MMPKPAPPPIDRSLADMWATYARDVIPPGTSKAAIQNNMFAFYGGASCVLDVLAAIGDEGVSDRAAVDAVNRLHHELWLFAAQQPGAFPKPGD